MLFTGRKTFICSKFHQKWCALYYSETIPPRTNSFYFGDCINSVPAHLIRLTSVFFKDTFLVAGCFDALEETRQSFQRSYKCIESPGASSFSRLLRRDVNKAPKKKKNPSLTVSVCAQEKGSRPRLHFSLLRIFPPDRSGYSRLYRTKSTT